MSLLQHFLARNQRQVSGHSESSQQFEQIELQEGATFREVFVLIPDAGLCSLAAILLYYRCTQPPRPTCQPGCKITKFTFPCYVHEIVCVNRQKEEVAARI